MSVNEEAQKQNRIENDQAYGRELSSLFKNLRAQSIGNIEYFQGASGSNLEKFYSNFTKLYDHLDNGIEPGVETLLLVAHKFDYDYSLPANGYRSMVKIIHKCCVHILQLTRHISINRSSFLFRAGHCSRELDAYVSTIGQLRALLYYLCRLIDYCKDGELFPDENQLSPEDYETAEQLMMEVETLSQETFYGRCLGFQYCESMKKPLKTIIVALASFSDGYNHNSTMMKVASSVLGSGRYIMNPELRAQQVVEVTRNSDIHFCKAFWSMNENTLMHQLPLFVCPPVQLDKVITLQPDVFDLVRSNGVGHAKIHPPCAHSGVGPVNTRLLSYTLRQGQEQWTSTTMPCTPVSTPTTPSTPGHKRSASSPFPHNSKLAPLSPCLLIHCHGGGFVAQSSASHQVYLRHWAKALDVPIFCVDYSLAPDDPFPRQLEEVFYAYCWAIKNARLLGSTGERICICGDSAGGNLSISVALRAAQYGIQIPAGILSSYGVTLVKYSPSPARITSLLDPLLPIGVVSNVLAAYAGVCNDNQTQRVPTKPHSDIMQSIESERINKVKHNTTRHKSMGSNDSGFDDIILNDMYRQQDQQKSATPNELPKPISPTCDSTGEDGDHFVDAMETIDGDTVVNGNMSIQSNTDVDMCRSTNAHGHVDSTNDMKSSGDSSAIRAQRQAMTLELTNTTLRKRANNKPPPLLHSPSMPSFGSVTSPNQRHSVGMTPCPNSPSNIVSPYKGVVAPQYAKVRHFAQSPMMQFRHLPIATNPYMSPQLASDEQLRTLCPVYLVACHLDPMLDDSVMFAKRLKAINKEVHLDVLPDLPHGFLNFTLVSREATAGSQVCIDRLKDIMKLHNPKDIQSYEIIKDEEIHCARNGAQNSMIHTG